MWFGPDYIYQCSECNRLHYKFNLLSGNDSGMELYSDTKSITPMSPESPLISKCSNCGSIMWIYKLPLINSNKWIELHGKTDWTDLKLIDFISFSDCLQIIDQKLYESDDEEIFVRKYLLWSFNDRVRKGTDLFVDSNDEDVWRGNINRLIELLDFENPDNRILLTELYRNIGEFGKAKEVLSSIVKSPYSWLKKYYRKEIKNKNKTMFKLL